MAVPKKQRRVVDSHPQKVRVAEVAPTLSHRADEGWINMAVQWVITEDRGGAKKSVFGITTFPPKARHDIHRHSNAEEIEYLIEGQGLARVGEVDVRMSPGDVVIAHPGEAHGFTNTSSTERAVLLWFYGGAASLEQAGYIYNPDGSGES